MEARAVNRYIGSSPRKMRIVIDMIRGKSVEAALNILHFSPKHAARTAEKVLRSAISNLQNKDEGGRIDIGTLYVKEAFVDGGPTLKRISPAPMGRAYRIRKRSNHLTIVVAQREQKKSVPPRKAETPKETKEKEAAPAAPATTKQKTKADTATATTAV